MVTNDGEIIKMKTIKGDLLKLAKDGKFDIIIHGCNCFCTMGAGIAKQIKKEFKAAYIADCSTKKGDRSKLGKMSYIIVDGVIVVNAYTQYHYGSGLQVDYDAVRQVFKKIKNEFSGKRIGFPKIGAGLAGGDWNIISKIIDEELEGEDFTLVLFD